MKNVNSKTNVGNWVTGARYVTRFLHGNNKAYRSKIRSLNALPLTVMSVPKTGSSLPTVKRDSHSRESVLFSSSVRRTDGQVDFTRRSCAAPAQFGSLLLRSARLSQCGFPSKRNGASDWTRRGHGVRGSSRLGSMD